MNILALVCCAQTQGNTDTLTDAFLLGASEAGHRTYKLHLGQHRVAPCLGCLRCDETGSCVQQDGMTDVLAALDHCDTVVFATPLYFWNISAQMKAVIDRFYAIGQPSKHGYFLYPRKQSALLVTAADSDSHFWVFEEAEHYYKRLVRYLRWTDLGILTAGKCGGTKEPRRISDTGHLERARQFGRTLGR